MTNFTDVQEFTRHLQLKMADKPSLLTDKTMAFRLDAMNEELSELAEATLDYNLPEIVDALIDLTYFAMGTAALMGVDWESHWNMVHLANMSKQRGTTKRGFEQDAKKPSTWTPPNHQLLLSEGPWAIHTP